MRIKTGDTVVVLTGKDKGKRGKITQASHREHKVIVEGANKVKKHMRPQKGGQKGERVEIEFPLNSSNVQLICPSCSKPTRVGYTILDDGAKRRVCKKCKAEIS